MLRHIVYLVVGALLVMAVLFFDVRLLAARSVWCNKRVHQLSENDKSVRQALEQAQATRDASLREHRARVEELTKKLGKEEEQKLVAQEKQRAAEEKSRQTQKELELMQRGADELAEAMSSAVAQRERELRAKEEEVRQLADGSADAAAAGSTTAGAPTATVTGTGTTSSASVYYDGHDGLETN